MKKCHSCEQAVEKNTVHTPLAPGYYTCEVQEACISNVCCPDCLFRCNSCGKWACGDCVDELCEECSCGGVFEHVSDNAFPVAVKFWNDYCTLKKDGAFQSLAAMHEKVTELAEAIKSHKPPSFAVSHSITVIESKPKQPSTGFLADSKFKQVGKLHISEHISKRPHRCGVFIDLNGDGKEDYEERVLRLAGSFNHNETIKAELFLVAGTYILPYVTFWNYIAAIVKELKAGSFGDPVPVTDVEAWATKRGYSIVAFVVPPARKIA